jgi:AcrR family transcriptional regulator
MFDRRQRILAETQGMLDELGVEGFTIRELSRRAGVAQRTLYNLFGSKEDIVATAIDEHFVGLLSQLPPPPPPGDLEASLQRIDFVSDRTIELRRYATAMVAVFFSPSADRRIYDALRWISEVATVPWVARAWAEGLLPKTTPEDRDRLATLLVNARYANVTDWAAGRISDQEMKIRSKLNFLVCVLPFAHASQRPKLQRLLERVRRDEAL